MTRKPFKEIGEHWASAPVSAIEDKARAFAIAAHSNTNQFYEGHEYTFHLCHVRDVAERFINLVPAPVRDEVCAGCWVHDVIEDTRKSYNDIRRILGETIAEYSFALTCHKGKTREERLCKGYYDDIKAVKFATFIKLCDRIANAEYNRFYRPQKSTSAGMLLKYQSENEKFMANLYDEAYKPMFDYLHEVLNPVPAQN